MIMVMRLLAASETLPPFRLNDLMLLMHEEPVEVDEVAEENAWNVYQ